MIPEDIKQLLHELRVIGGGHVEYESGDDREMLQSFLAAKGMTLPTDDAADWHAIHNMLEHEKKRIKKEMDDYYRAFLW